MIGFKIHRCLEVTVCSCHEMAGRRSIPQIAMQMSTLTIELESQKYENTFEILLKTKKRKKRT